MHLFANGSAILHLLQSTTCTPLQQQAAQHGSSCALPGRRRQSSSSPDEAQSLIHLELGTTTHFEPVADRHQADRDMPEHWTSACRTKLADTGADDLAPERSADVESLPETRLGVQPNTSSSIAMLTPASDPSLWTSIPILEQNSPLRYGCVYATCSSPSMETYSGLYPDMASVDHGRESDDTADDLTSSNVRQRRCLIPTCEPSTRGFARKYDRTRHWCPAFHANSPSPTDASREPQMASSEVAAASLTAHIVCMNAILSQVASAVLLAQDTDPQRRPDVLGSLSGNHLVRV